MPPSIAIRRSPHISRSPWSMGIRGVVLLVITGSLVTSYNKARAAIEIPVDNKARPDLLERPARLFLLCGSLIMDAAVPIPSTFGGRLLYLMLIVLSGSGRTLPRFNVSSGRTV